MDIGGEGVLPVEQNDSTQSTNLNISDVIDAISKADRNCVALFDAEVEAMPHQDMACSSGQPFVRIVEQPAGKALRFRYECEGRSAGSIPGCNSTPERKTYPTIEIHGHRGWAIIVVSCVTRDAPHKPHPHNLVGRERCENGVCTVKTNITDENPQVSFSNLGIQCVKRKDIAEALRTRERLRVDPFRTGFGHLNQLQSIDLNAVRLCFQVFIQDEKSGKIRRSLPPVVSDVIYDKKAMSDLYIMRVSHCSAPPKGGTEVILLCERITKEDIAVVFFEKEGDRVVWEEAANIILVHRQYAIVFHTPPYRQPAATSNVQVFLQLKRTSDDARSNPLPFEYTPDLNPDPSHLARKRQKTISSLLQQYEPNRNFQDQQIKAEPNKTPPHPHLGSPLQVYSPHYEQEPVQENMSYQWNLQEPSMSGLSHVNYPQDVQWGPNYMQMANLQSVSPNLQSASPNLQSVSPNLQAMSPNMQAMSPNMQSMSPNMQAMSPNMQAMSPNMQQNLQAMSPMHMQMSGMGRISPMTHGGMSPNLRHVSPGLGHSPGLGQPSPGMGQPSPGMGHVSPHMMHDQSVMMEMNPPDPQSFTLTSGELSGLDALLGRGPDLSDSLNRLSTSDLLH